MASKWAMLCVLVILMLIVIVIADLNLYMNSSETRRLLGWYFHEYWHCLCAFCPISLQCDNFIV